MAVGKAILMWTVCLQHSSMKTVSLDDEAYNLLKGAKVSPADSFSDVVKRHFGGKRPDIWATHGAWKDMTDDEVRALREETNRALDRPRKQR